MKNRKDLVKDKSIAGEVYWGKDLFTANEMSKKYQLTLCNLSDAAVEFLTALDVNVRNDKEGQGNFIVCKSLYPIRTQDSHGMAWDEDVLIGNGSKASVLVDIFEFDNSFGHWVNVQAKKVQIDELVHYEAEEGEGEPQVISGAI